MVKGASERFSPEQTEALCARLDEAFSILADPEQSKRYRAYVAQQRGERAPLDPADFLHPIVAEWSAKSTAIPAPASPAPETTEPTTADGELPAGPPPWLGDRRPAAETARPAAWEVEPPVAPEGADEGELDDTLHNEWGDHIDERELARTVPMGPAAARPAVADLSSLTRLTGRRAVTAMPPVRTLPGASLPVAPHDED
jgi:hypothetical protein